MTALQIISLIGLVLLLGAFALNSFRLVAREGLIYNLINFVGGTLLTWYSIQINSLPFIILESVWALIGLYGVIKYLCNKEQ